MSGPIPKSSATRQRKNKTSTAAMLETTEREITEAPDLGEHPDGGEWHERTLSWWLELWRSPMRGEYLRADVDGLMMLAALIDRAWWNPDERPKMATEIRLQRQCFGLTPIDRRRLQWETHRVEEAERRKPQRPQPKGADPRKVLRAI